MEPSSYPPKRNGSSETTAATTTSTATAEQQQQPLQEELEALSPNAMAAAALAEAMNDRDGKVATAYVASIVAGVRGTSSSSSSSAAAAAKTKRNVADGAGEDSEGEEEGDGGRCRGHEQSLLRRSTKRTKTAADSTAGGGAMKAATMTTSTATGSSTGNESVDILQRLSEIWDVAAATAATSESSSLDAAGGAGIEVALKSTLRVVNGELNYLIGEALSAFHNLDRAERENRLLSEDVKVKEDELARLRVAEEKSRSTISNLLHASEKSHNDLQDASRAAITEAALRAELASVKSSRDIAAAGAEESKRKVLLLEEELKHVRKKLSTTAQEKMKMERDHRATLSLAKTLDSQASTDVEFYKRKVAELANQVQGANAQVLEKDRQLEEMRRQMARNMSQSRLAHHRAATGLSSSSSTTTNFGAGNSFSGHKRSSY